jgi:hypothetical protein
LYSTVLTREDYEYMSGQQRESMGVPIEFVEEIEQPKTKIRYFSYDNMIESIPVTKVAESNVGYGISVGDMVVHKKFGEGIVKGIEDDILEIAFGNQTKTLSYRTAMSLNLLEVKK